MEFLKDSNCIIFLFVFGLPFYLKITLLIVLLNYNTITTWTLVVIFFLLRFYLFSFRDRGKEGEREGEKHQCASCSPPTGDLAGNPGMYPDWDLNLQHFGLQANTQSTESHQPGPE